MIDGIIIGLLVLCVIGIVWRGSTKRKQGNCHNGCEGCPLAKDCKKKEEG